MPNPSCRFYVESLCSIIDCDECAYAKEFVPCPYCGEKWWRDKPYCPNCREFIPKARRDVADYKKVKQVRFN